MVINGVNRLVNYYTSWRHLLCTTLFKHGVTRLVISSLDALVIMMLFSLFLVNTNNKLTTTCQQHKITTNNITLPPPTSYTEICMPYQDYFRSLCNIVLPNRLHWFFISTWHSIKACMCLNKNTKDVKCLKIWQKHLRAYDVLKLKKN